MQGNGAVIVICPYIRVRVAQHSMSDQQRAMSNEQFNDETGDFVPRTPNHVPRSPFCME
jgi:hypothetical protein